MGYPRFVIRTSSWALAAAAVLTATLGLASRAAGQTPSSATRQRIDRVGANLFSATPHPTEAIAELKNILAADPGSAEAHLLLGLAYRIQDKPELLGEAIAELRQALALNPEIGLARVSLARIYLDMARPARARDELTIALKQAPSAPQVLALLGEAERQLGNSQRAIELNQQALAADAGFAQARYYLGLALLDAGRQAAAIKELQQVVQSGANPAEANFGLGSAYLGAGRLTEAIAALRESVRLDPTKPDAHIRLAHAYRAKGQLADAEKELGVVARSADSIAALYSTAQVDYYLELGLIRLAQNRLEPAAAAFHKVLALDATNAAARDSLAAVNKRRQQRAAPKAPEQQ